MKIHKEGHKILIAFVLFFLLLNVIVYHVVSSGSLFFHFTLAASVVIFLIILNFFRSPARIFPHQEKDLIAAPADGRIVVIENVRENEYFKDERLQISVFMSIFNAHVNWIPVNGKVIHFSHQSGRFKAAYLPKSSTENERTTIVIETENGETVLVRQIAGALAKRISTYVTEGSPCHINEQMGFIKFGSRVDIFLPVGSEVLVKMNQEVYGNETPLAKLVR